MTSIPSTPMPAMHELIRECGVKSTKRCGCCNGWTLWWVEGEWFACSWCDVENDERWK